MPYADPEKQKEARRDWYRRKYNSDPEFKGEEAARKAKWLQTEAGKESNNEANWRYRTKKKRAHFVARFLTRV